MLNKKLFEPKFGDWWTKIEPIFSSGEMDIIYDFLKKEGQKGKLIAPESTDTFRCFTETPLRDLKVVILGLCPYHSVRNDIIVADGLAMSCSKTGVLQPSLQQFYRALEVEFKDGLSLGANLYPDLKSLANQGVLLLNAALTVEVGQPSSHNTIWAKFTEFVLQEIIALTGVPVVFLGQLAADFSYFLPSTQPQFFLSHPASAAYSKTEWSSEGTFKAVNKILQDTNGTNILWIDDMPF